MARDGLGAFTDDVDVESGRRGIGSGSLNDSRSRHVYSIDSASVSCGRPGFVSDGLIVVSDAFIDVSVEISTLRSENEVRAPKTVV